MSNNSVEIPLYNTILRNVCKHVFNDSNHFNGSFNSLNALKLVSNTKFTMELNVTFADIISEMHAVKVLSSGIDSIKDIIDLKFPSIPSLNVENNVQHSFVRWLADITVLLRLNSIGYS